MSSAFDGGKAATSAWDRRGLYRTDEDLGEEKNKPLVQNVKGVEAGNLHDLIHRLRAAFTIVSEDNASSSSRNLSYNTLYVIISFHFIIPF